MKVTRKQQRKITKAAKAVFWSFTGLVLLSATVISVNEWITILTKQGVL